VSFGSDVINISSDLILFSLIYKLLKQEILAKCKVNSLHFYLIKQLVRMQKCLQACCKMIPLTFISHYATDRRVNFIEFGFN